MILYIVCLKVCKPNLRPMNWWLATSFSSITIYRIQPSSLILEELPFNFKQTDIYENYSSEKYIYVCYKQEHFFNIKNLNFKKYVKCSRNVNRNFHLIFHMVM